MKQRYLDLESCVKNLRRQNVSLKNAKDELNEVCESEKMIRGKIEKKYQKVNDITIALRAQTRESNHLREQLKRYKHMESEINDLRGTINHYKKKCESSRRRNSMLTRKIKVLKKNSKGRQKISNLHSNVTTLDACHKEETTKIISRLKQEIKLQEKRSVGLVSVLINMSLKYMQNGKKPHLFERDTELLYQKSLSNVLLGAYSILKTTVAKPAGKKNLRVTSSSHKDSKRKSISSAAVQGKRDRKGTPAIQELLLKFVWNFCAVYNLDFRKCFVSQRLVELLHDSYKHQDEMVRFYSAVLVLKFCKNMPLYMSSALEVIIIHAITLLHNSHLLDIFCDFS